MPGVLAAAAFDGFTRRALSQAAVDAGVDASQSAIAWPNGVDDALAFWSGCADAAAQLALAGEEAQHAKIREKVAIGVKARLEYFSPNKEAARRAAAALAFPYRHSLAARMTWSAADAIWRGLGDTSTDINFYTKRAILSGVISSTQVRWLADDDPEMAATIDFLHRRIENVMQFEKVKARFRGVGEGLKAPLKAAAKARYR